MGIFTFATTATAIGILVGCNSDTGTIGSFYGLPCAGDACDGPGFPDSGRGFGYDGDVVYEDASFPDDSAIDASSGDADASDAGNEDAD